MIKNTEKQNEEHCCDDVNIPINKYLQIGSKEGKFLLAVGESPAGNGWLKSGRAFFTPNGKVVPTGKNFLINLEQISLNLSLENISFTEISKCYIGNNRKQLINCSTKTWAHFIEQIKYINPKIIILLGKHTTDIFNQLSGSSLLVGELQKINIDDQTYNILPLYHPSPLNPKRIQNSGFIQSNIKNIRDLLEVVQ